MSYVMVDVEADGPITGDYSMIALRAIIVEPSLEQWPLAAAFLVSARLRFGS